MNDLNSILNYVFITLVSRWPDLVITIISVTVAGLITVKIAKWQFKKQKEMDHERELEQLAIIYEKMIEEIERNINHLDYIFKVLLKNEHKNTDFFNWLVSLSNSLSWIAYEQYENSGLQGKLPKEIDKTIDESYLKIKDVYYMCNEKKASFNYLLTTNSLRTKDFNSGTAHVRHVLEYLNAIITRLKEVDIYK